MSHSSPPQTAEEPPTLGWSFPLLWIVLTAAGRLLLAHYSAQILWIFTEGQALPPYYEPLTGRWLLTWIGNGVIGSLVDGLIIGGLQWFLLRRYVSWAGLWLYYSVVGWGLVTLWDNVTNTYMFEWFITPTQMVFAGSVVGGTLLGTMQWLVLRSRVRGGGWWIAANGLAWFTGSFLSFLITVFSGIPPYQHMDSLPGVVITVIRVMIRESIPALCLFWLLTSRLKIGISDRENIDLWKKTILKNSRYSYQVTWSEEDQEYIGVCVKFPSLSWLAPTPEEALEGIREEVAGVVAEMKVHQETAPVNN